MQTVLGVAVLHCAFTFFFVGARGMTQQDVPLLLVGYGFGASFVALFAQARAPPFCTHVHHMAIYVSETLCRRACSTS